MPTDREAQAWERLQEAYQAQMEGDYDRAIELYRRSFALHPTAEAHTFLGWTFHFQGKIDEAIAECKRAIEGSGIRQSLQRYRRLPHRARTL